MMPDNKSKKAPPTSKWSQQELPVWQPIINFRTMWKILLILGVFLTIVSIPLISVLQSQEEEIRIIYADPSDCSCKTCCPKSCVNVLSISKTGGKCAKCIAKSDSDCEISFDVTEETKLSVPVYVYYELDHFHQNHRSYVSSRDDNQLLGLIYKDESMKEIIEPYTDGCKDPFRKEENGSKFYFPCGAIANSFFSDIFLNLKHSSLGLIAWNEEDIVWSQEKNYKFKNPVFDKTRQARLKFSAITSGFNEKFTKPKSWSDNTWKDWWDKGGLENPHFINWMHPAPISNFRKLYAIINKGCAGGKGFLCPGKYTVKINYRFDVEEIKTRKTLIFSTTRFWGTKKPFLVWFGLSVGIICIVIGLVFCILNNKLKKKVHPQLLDTEEPATD